MENRQYEKAVELFVASGQPRKALELCLQHNIAITEAMAESLSNDEDGKPNTDLLNEVYVTISP
jgi:phosphoglycolate phosphatase-like HAD superfamily hydrolase